MSRRYDFAWDRAYRVAGLPFGVTPRTAYVEVDDAGLHVRFSIWSLDTPRDNVVAAQLTGGYAFVKTAGPPHLSFSDHGVSFATNGRRGLCLSFREPVRGIDPTRRLPLRHPGVTLTVADPDGLAADLGLAVQSS